MLLILSERHGLDPPPPQQMCTLLHYFDDHAHSNGQERVYPHTLSCLLNGGRHSLNLVWGYTWTLPPFFRQYYCIIVVY